MKLLALSGILLLVAVGAVMLTTNIYLEKNRILWVQEVDVDFEVGSYAGLTTDNDALHFGTHLPGGGGKRWFNVTNTNAYPVTIETKFSGETAPYLYGPEEPVVVAPGEFGQIQVKLSVPGDMGYGNYTGKVQLVFKERS